MNELESDALELPIRYIVENFNGRQLFKQFLKTLGYSDAAIASIVNKVEDRHAQIVTGERPDDLNTST